MFSSFFSFFLVSVIYEFRYLASNKIKDMSHTFIFFGNAYMCIPGIEFPLHTLLLCMPFAG